MPVLPELGSRMMSPATSCPSASAVSTIDLAIRSLTDPPGFIPSAVTVGDPPTCGRRMVGMRTSTGIGIKTSWHPVYKFPTIRSAFENDLGLLDVPVGDAE